METIKHSHYGSFNHYLPGFNRVFYTLVCLETR